MLKRLNAGNVVRALALAVASVVIQGIAWAAPAQASDWPIHWQEERVASRFIKSKVRCNDNLHPVARTRWVKKRILRRREQHYVVSRAATHGFEFDPNVVRPWRDLNEEHGRRKVNRTHLIKPVKRRVVYVPPVYDTIHVQVPVNYVGSYCGRRNRARHNDVPAKSYKGSTSYRGTHK